ncbi:hypothetical protein [Enterobacter hormaechei]|uniref:hypothetical protein n=1 Tax=Enterobacter hormaechei TaxID=158836 RepID=UPI000CEBB0C3|nr:hypothetical protein [Enterobacter hormaechei]ROC77438.1 hypothetical protein C4Z25_014680 [Enterobacter hormaechei subsp. steigerwaltii]
MRISLDSFADMLGMKAGEVLHVLRTGGELDGVPLPATLRRKIRHTVPDGSRATLDLPLKEATDFMQKWQERDS